MDPIVVTIQPNGKRIFIDTKENLFKKGDPYLYVVQHNQATKSPIYVGETGKSKSYSVIDRLRFHFHKSESSTLNRIYKNTRAYGFDMPETLLAYIFPLPSKYKSISGTKNRESLESWVIHILCHQRKVQSSYFVVTKYCRPCSSKNVKQLAVKIVDTYLSSNQGNIVIGKNEPPKI